MNDIAIDLFCGLGGWTEGFLAEGFDVIGFDIERHDYGTGGYPGWLVLQDILSISGTQFKALADRLRVIVASPPCQKYSYMAMPWKKAKALASWYREEEQRQVELNALFNACFRIQREASEAAGRYIPMIVENVRGAQPWVGRARAHFGSFYLWGDVGQVARRVMAGKLVHGGGVSPRSRTHKVPGFRFDGSGKSFQSAAVKVSGQNWSRYAKTGEVSPHWRMEARNGEGGSRFGNYAEMKAEGRGAMNRRTSSNSLKRKSASAAIAKIPFPLANYIAKCFKS